MHKRFGRKMVLNDISIHLDDGVYGLLGPNGSGKTTLMRCIAGVLPATSGTIRAPEQIGYLPQKFGMFKELKVFEALEYFAELKGIPRNEQDNAIGKCLASVHLEHQANDKVKTLSGGMVRRLGVAQAILGDPKLLLVDEPTAGLDPEERLRFKNLISEIGKERTVLISTHIVEDVEALCNHIIIMAKGQIIFQNTADQIRGTAKGCVYAVPEADRSHLIAPFSILRNEEISGEIYLRVLSAVKQPGEEISPSVEDGYMRLIGSSK